MGHDIEVKWETEEGKERPPFWWYILIKMFEHWIQIFAKIESRADFSFIIWLNQLLELHYDTAVIPVHWLLSYSTNLRMIFRISFYWCLLHSNYRLWLNQYQFELFYNCVFEIIWCIRCSGDFDENQFTHKVDLCAIYGERPRTWKNLYDNDIISRCHFSL